MFAVIIVHHLEGVVLLLNGNDTTILDISAPLLGHLKLGIHFSKILDRYAQL